MNFHFFKRKIRIRKAIINEKNYFYLVNVSLKKKIMLTLEYITRFTAYYICILKLMCLNLKIKLSSI